MIGQIKDTYLPSTNQSGTFFLYIEICYFNLFGGRNMYMSYQERMQNKSDQNQYKTCKTNTNPEHSS